MFILRFISSLLSKTSLFDTYRVVFAGDPAPASLRRVEAGVQEAERLGVTLGRFAGLDPLKVLSPEAVLREAIWHTPGKAEPTALLAP
jgi:hypothetical protein